MPTMINERTLRANLIIFLSYFITAELSIRIISIPSLEPLIWPASGIALAGVLLFGPRIWPAIALGTLLLGYPFATWFQFFAALGAAIGNVSEPIIAAYILRRFQFSLSFLNSRSILTYFLTLAAITPIGATINAFVFNWFHSPPEYVQLSSSIKDIWVKWWLGDLLGYIIVTPAILSWMHWKSRTWPRFSAVDLVTLLGTFCVICAMLLFGWHNEIGQHIGPYVLFPILIWATVRYGRIGATTTIFSVSYLGSLAVLMGKGAFIGLSVAEDLIRFHAFMLAYSFTGLTLAAFLAELRTAQATIRKRQETLEELVNRRTRDLTLANEELKRSKYFLDQAQKIAKVGSYRYNPNTNSDQWSNELYTIFEFPKEKFRGVIEDFYSIVPEPYRTQIKEMLDEAVTKKKGYALEYMIQTPSGKQKFIKEKGIPIINMDGTVQEIIGTAQDITEVKKIEEQLQLAKRLAEEASQAKTNFLAHMSHEIRTPLGIILGFTDLLSDPGLSAQERTNYISTIQKNGRMLASLINQVLDLSKIETGKIETEVLEVQTIDILRDIKHLMEPKANENGLQLKFSFREAIPTQIHSDPTALRQIFVNVIGNAIKFTPSGRVEVRTRVIRSKGRTLLAFDVADTGVGLTIEQRNRLFKPFSQADATTTRKYGGTGLGLYLSKRLAQALGGDLRLLKSLPQKGSVFRLTIDPGPITGTIFKKYTEIPDVEIAPFPIATTPLIREKKLSGKKLLLVEDSEDNQRLVMKLLNMEGAHVDVAPNGAIGVEKALRREYDAVLMDIQMPIMDGYEATRHLRESGYTAPIIALTAHAMLEEKERCLRSGFSDYLSKPINKSDLVEHILLAETLKATTSLNPL